MKLKLSHIELLENNEGLSRYIKIEFLFLFFDGDDCV